MRRADFSETRQLIRAAVVCTVMGASLGALFATCMRPDPSFGLRGLMLAGVLLGGFCAKVASGVATFSGWIILLPVACTPMSSMTAIAVLLGGVGSGDLDLVKAIFAAVAFFSGAAIEIKLDS